tara:strand:- start:2439 stop:2660 length:222 start_codon:yes stop_codon:yes gene_type:complete
MSFIDDQVTTGLTLLLDVFVLHEISQIHKDISSQSIHDRSESDNEVLAASRVLIKYYMPPKEFLEWELKGEEL